MKVKFPELVQCVDCGQAIPKGMARQVDIGAKLRRLPDSDDDPIPSKPWLCLRCHEALQEMVKEENSKPIRCVDCGALIDPEVGGYKMEEEMWTDKEGNAHFEWLGEWICPECCRGLEDLNGALGLPERPHQPTLEEALVIRLAPCDGPRQYLF